MAELTKWTAIELEPSDIAVKASTPGPGGGLRMYRSEGQISSMGTKTVAGQ
jgi:hypothetical protein